VSESSSSGDDSPPSDSDTSIDDDLIEAKISNDDSNLDSSAGSEDIHILEQSATLPSCPPPTTADEEEDDIVILEVVRKPLPPPHLLPSSQHPNPLLQRPPPNKTLPEKMAQTQIRRTNSIAGLLSEVSTTANKQVDSQAASSDAPKPSTSKMSLTIGQCSTTKLVPATVVPQLKIVSFGSCGAGSSSRVSIEARRNQELLMTMPGKKKTPDVAASSSPAIRASSPEVIDLDSSDDDCIDID
jgi:hypothetical protein